MCKDFHNDCKSTERWRLGDNEETPRKAQQRKRESVRRNRVGYLPELLAIESKAESRHGRNENQHKAIFSTKPRIDLSLIEFEFNTNSKTPRSQTFASANQIQLAKRKPIPAQSTKLTDVDSPRDSVIADLVALITDLECRRLRELASDEKKREEEMRLKSLREKNAQAERVKQEAEKVLADESKKLSRASVPSDVKEALVAARALTRVIESPAYNRFLKDPHPTIKALRIAIGKAAGAVPNKLGNTMQRLTHVYEGLERNRREITAAGANESLKQSGFDLSQFAALMRSIVDLCGEPLQILLDMPLLTFHFYLKLSSVLLDNAQQQMSRNAATKWTYAHFLALLWRQWGEDFKLIYMAVLHGRSNWAIPWPSQDLKIREEASNDVLADWCHETSGYLSLKMAMYVCLQDSAQCWQLLARLLNRISEKTLTHPAVPFLLADSLVAVNHFLCSTYMLQMTNIHNLLRTIVVPRLLEITRLPESWKEVRVPTTRLHLLLNDLDARQPATQPPEGYVLSAEEEELNADL